MTNKFRAVKHGLNLLLIASIVSPAGVIAAPPTTGSPPLMNIRISEDNLASMGTFLKDIKGVCGSAPEPGKEFKCAGGDAAASKLQAMIANQQDLLRKAISATYHELPVTVQRQVSAGCLAQSAQTQASFLLCAETVLKKTPEKFNRAQALGKLYAASKFETQGAIASNACFQAKGENRERDASTCAALSSFGVLTQMTKDEVASKPSKGGEPAESDVKSENHMFGRAPIVNANGRKEGFDTKNPDALMSSENRSSGRGSSLIAKGGDGVDGGLGLMNMDNRDIREVLACPVPVKFDPNCPPPKDSAPTTASIAQASKALSEQELYQQVANRLAKEQIRGLLKLAQRPGGFGDKLAGLLYKYPDACENKEMRKAMLGEIDAVMPRIKEVANNAKSEAKGTRQDVIQKAARIREAEAESVKLLAEFYDDSQGEAGSAQGVEAFMSEGWGGLIPCGFLVKGFNRATSMLKDFTNDHKDFKGHCLMQKRYGKTNIIVSPRFQGKDPGNKMLETCQNNFLKVNQLQNEIGSLRAEYPELSVKVDGKQVSQALGATTDSEQLINESMRQLVKDMGGDNGTLDKVKELCADPTAAAKKLLADPAQVNYLFSCGGDERAPLPVVPNNDPVQSIVNIDPECKYIRKHANDLCGYIGTAEWEEQHRQFRKAMLAAAGEGTLNLGMLAMDVQSCAMLGLSMNSMFRAGASEAGVSLKALNVAFKEGGIRQGLRMAARGTASGAKMVGKGALAVVEDETLALVPSKEMLKNMLTKEGAKTGAKAFGKAAWREKAFLGFTGFAYGQQKYGESQAAEALRESRVNCMMGNGSACDSMGAAQDAYDNAVSHGGWETVKFAVAGKLIPGHVNGKPTPRMLTYLSKLKMFQASEAQFNRATKALGDAQASYKAVKSKGNLDNLDKAIREYNKVSNKYKSEGNPLLKAYKDVMAEVDPNIAKNATVQDANHAQTYLKAAESLSDAQKTLGQELTASDARAIAKVHETLLSSDLPEGQRMKTPEFMKLLADDVKAANEGKKPPEWAESFLKDKDGLARKPTVEDLAYIRAIEETRKLKGIPDDEFKRQRDDAYAACQAKG
jgi:hypothetical protein